MSDHAPGPWEAKFEEAIRVRDKDGTVAIAMNLHLWGRRDASEVEANARLIAAAPELLAACEEFCRKVESGEARSTLSYQQMKAAIAKARGNEGGE